MTIKYCSNDELAKVPFQASEDATGYDLFAAKAKTPLPSSCNSIEFELKMAMTKGYYGKIFPRSGLLRDHFVTCDEGVIDADYRGSVSAILINHHGDKHYTVTTGDRIAQFVIMKKFDVKFKRVYESGLLGKTKRGIGGFGSTGTYGSIPLKRTSPLLDPGEILVVSDDDKNDSDD